MKVRRFVVQDKNGSGVNLRFILQSFLNLALALLISFYNPEDLKGYEMDSPFEK